MLCSLRVLLILFNDQFIAIRETERMLSFLEAVAAPAPTMSLPIPLNAVKDSKTACNATYTPRSFTTAGVYFTIVLNISTRASLCSTIQIVVLRMAFIILSRYSANISSDIEATTALKINQEESTVSCIILDAASISPPDSLSFSINLSRASVFDFKAKTLFNEIRPKLSLTLFTIIVCAASSPYVFVSLFCSSFSFFRTSRRLAPLSIPRFSAASAVLTNACCKFLPAIPAFIPD